MASYTTNLNLIKPTINDPFNVEDANSNMQKIDEAYEKISDATIPISPDVAAALGLTGNPQVKDALGKIATFGVSKRYFTSSDTFTAPYTGKYFVELCGGGSYGKSTSDGWGDYSGGAGGYAAKTITLSKGSSIPVTVGTCGDTTSYPACNGGTSSFGAYLSATGGVYRQSDADNGSPAAGYGIGGDVNLSGTTGCSNTISIAGVSYLGRVTPGSRIGWGCSGMAASNSGLKGVVIITMLHKGE